MDEKQVKSLQEETKKLLDKFSKALSSIRGEEESNVERESDRRKEGEGKECDNNFRKIMLENSPSHDENSIIAETKTW